MISGVILAGGLGRRMGGVDKGLQAFDGKPLVQWVIERFAPQVDELLINANRNANIDIDGVDDRRIDVDAYGQMIRETFETLYREGAETGRLLVLHLRPWLTGQPFRIGRVEAALRHIVSRRGVWTSTGSEIVEAYRRARA